MVRHPSSVVEKLVASRLVTMLVLTAAMLAPVACVHAAEAKVLVDQTWADGRSQSSSADHMAVWIGRPQDVSVYGGVMSVKMGDVSQKIWAYFTPSEPVTLAAGQTLTAAVSFIPRGALYENTSRSFRMGLFNDPTDPRVEKDTNTDSGGENAPWTDATGYAVQLLLTNDAYTGTAVFDLGKRTDLAHPSLLGTSDDYSKLPGGARVSEELGQQYTLKLAVKKISDNEVILTASLYEGDERIATTTVRDNGSQLGAAAPYDKFDMLAIRLSDNLTTADQIDFTHLKLTLE